MRTRFRNNSHFHIYLLVLGILIQFSTENIFGQNIKNSAAFANNSGQDRKPKKSYSVYKSNHLFSFRSSEGYFPSLIYNISHQATAPLHFNSKQWLLTGIFIGTTAILINYDNDIDEWAHKLKQNHVWINKGSPVMTEFGGNYGIFTVGTIGLLSVAMNNKKGIQTSLLATQALITSGIWIQIIKQLTGRERPLASYSNNFAEGGHWSGPFSQYDSEFQAKKYGSSYDAFASGHTATAFSIATVFASQYKETVAIPIVCYTLATLVGLSRLTEHQHWSSDVFFGAVIGYLCGKQVVSHFKKLHPNQIKSEEIGKKNQKEISFIFQENKFGIKYKW